MTRKPGSISRHYIEYRLVALYGGAYFFTLTVASIMFYKMMTMKFFHPLFWSWMGWTLITTYCFFLFMRAVLSPAIQIYPDKIVLSHPKSRTIHKEEMRSLFVDESTVELSFMEDNKEQSLTFKIRPDRPIEAA